MSDETTAGEVGDDERLWRRIHRKQLVPDGSGGTRISSGAFTDPEMSVDRADLVEADGRTHKSVMLPTSVGVAEFTARLARSLSQRVLARPLPGNDAHAEVHGDKKKRAVRNAFRDESVFLA